MSVALLLAACGPGTLPDQRPGDETDLDGLRVKMHALMADPCYTAPLAQRPQGCEKFTTQLRSLANAATSASRARYPRLEAPARQLSAGISAYRTGGCHTSAPESAERCGSALVEVARALDALDVTLTSG